MGVEIERKFLVANDGWRNLSQGVLCRQGYLNRNKDRTVRVRSMDGRAYLTIKGLSYGATRQEYEYEIPLADGNVLLDAVAEKPLVEKKRHHIPWGAALWVVDEFLGENTGLILAEIELASENEAFDAPPWIGAEVTRDSRYYNANLVKYPFSRWQAAP